jgi:4-diphosphocytidyl-2C-methyl-D-erythritol kinase
VKLGYKGVLGAVISALLIWWTLRGESPAAIWAALRGGDLWLLSAAVFVATAGFLLRAMRWKVLLQPLAPDTSLDSRFGAVTIGFMANNLLPARVGEVVRAYALSRMEKVSMSGALGTLAVERILDGVVLLVFLLLPPLLPGFPEAAAGDATLRAVVGGASLALALILAVLAALLLWPEGVVRTVERALARFPERFARRAVGATRSFLDALQIVRRPALLAQAVAWSFAFWTFHGASFWLAMAAFGVREGFAAAIFTEAAVGFGVALPSAPGFIGTFHAAASWALEGVYGIDAARSLAFAYGYHLGGFFPVTFIGLWYARRVGLSLREMGRREDVVDLDLERGGGSGPAGVPAPGRDELPAGSAESRGGPPSRVIELDAPAKVNLFLRVLEREPSGYHRIRTLFQSLELSDTLTVEAVSGGDVSLEVVGLDAGPPEDNLVRRAALRFAEAAETRVGAKIRLEKRIPAGGGLGGGSSDAAATLRALDLLLPGALPRPRLLELAAELGSDVPFFLCGSPLALGEGHGEALTPLPPLPPAEVILALPPLAVSTAWAYGALDRRRGSADAPGPRHAAAGADGDPVDAFAGVADWDSVRALGVNDFSEVVREAHPLIAAATDALAETRPLIVLLSGSGSSVFALYADARGAEEAFGRLTPWDGVRFVRTRTRTSPPEVRGAGDTPAARHAASRQPRG